MTYEELMEETGLGRRAVEKATGALVSKGVIIKSHRSAPAYGESEVAFRLEASLLAYANTDVRQLCVEADKAGDKDSKVAALETFIEAWFPSDNKKWGRVFPSKVKLMLDIVGGSALTVYEYIEDTGLNPEIRDDSKVIVDTKDFGSYLVNLVRNKRVEQEYNRRPTEKQDEKMPATSSQRRGKHDHPHAAPVYAH